jgi:hypothetical protein
MKISIDDDGYHQQQFQHHPTLTEESPRSNTQTEPHEVYPSQLIGPTAHNARGPVIFRKVLRGTGHFAFLEVVF